MWANSNAHAILEFRMTLDLFDDPHAASLEEFQAAIASWLTNSSEVVRASSRHVYEHMWSAFSAWAIGNQIAIANITAADLEQYLGSRGSAEELSPRYVWRLLRLVDRILQHQAQARGLVENRAAAEVLASHPGIRFANASESDTLPQFFGAAEAKQLVVYLSSVRPGRASAGRSWQEIRDRASVGLMLGAGITPGEVRALTLKDVVEDGGNRKRMPWKLRIAGNGNAAARETPVAAWAGQLLRYWLDIRMEQGLPGAMVFPATKATGKVWGKVAQYNAAKEVLRAAGMDDPGGGSFRLRHTFAIRQLRRGKRADDVAQWLGVSDPAVMARYGRVLSAPVDLV